jgi:DNA replication and repair protein RecF
MFHFENLTLVQFKNYASATFSLNERIIGICGNNGVGKTNLLDALHYLCFTKSYFTRDTSNIRQGNQGFRIEGHVNLFDEKEKVVCILRETGKKEFLLNNEPYTRFSKHIGRYPCVMIAPDDIQLIIGIPDERRKFIDTILSQLSSEYLQNLIIYTKILQQRNSCLRSITETNNRDFSLLDVLDEQLMIPGSYIFEKRKIFMVGFLPLAKQLYEDIARQPENISLFYNSELMDLSYPELLKMNRAKDLVAMRTTGGVHRDDLELNFNNLPFKQVASQGQRKSLLFALKLAEMEILKNEKKFTPVLMLDDVFEKLDEERIGNLLERVCLLNDGQVFITDTNAIRLEEKLIKLKRPYQMINLNND